MRAEYEPVFARLYGIRPWEMPQLTYRQFRRLRADADQLLNPEGR